MTHPGFTGRPEFTDYDAALVFLTAAAKYGLNYVPSERLAQERVYCPWLEPVIERHSPGQVEWLWVSFRAAVHPPESFRITPSAQAVRVVSDFGWAVAAVPLHADDYILGSKITQAVQEFLTSEADPGHSPTVAIGRRVRDLMTPKVLT